MTTVDVALSGQEMYHPVQRSFTPDSHETTSVETLETCFNRQICLESNKRRRG